jgi:hypothetical protein
MYRFAGNCSQCGQCTDASRAGTVACKWGRCNGTVEAIRIASNDTEDEARRWAHWINIEIPDWLARFKSFEEFDASTVGAAASGQWKMAAYAMAAERWKKKIQRVPR